MPDRPSSDLTDHKPFNKYETLPPEDYREPACVLCGKPESSESAVRMIPLPRVIEKLNACMDRRDYDEAGRILGYWLDEAILCNDRRGELGIRNELIGYCRKTGNREGAMEHISRAGALVKELSFEGTVSAGTTFVNAGTACHAFGEYERAMAYFDAARSIYEAHANTSPELLGGLYNNMALACTALGQYKDALSLYKKALSAMEKVPGSMPEQAITCLNMADTVLAEKGAEEGDAEISALADRAFDLLDDPSCRRDGYYAFVCEKCAPVFAGYGYFLAEEELKKRAEEIYERNRKS